MTHKRTVVGAVILAIVVIVRFYIVNNITTAESTRSKVEKWNGPDSVQYREKCPHIAMQMEGEGRNAVLVVQGSVENPKQLDVVKQFVEADYPSFYPVGDPRRVQTKGPRLTVRYDVDFRGK